MRTLILAILVAVSLSACATARGVPIEQANTVLDAHERCEQMKRTACRTNGGGFSAATFPQGSVQQAGPQQQSAGCADPGYSSSSFGVQTRNFGFATSGSNYNPGCGGGFVAPGSAPFLGGGNGIFGGGQPYPTYSCVAPFPNLPPSCGYRY